MDGHRRPGGGHPGGVPRMAPPARHRAGGALSVNGIGTLASIIDLLFTILELLRTETYSPPEVKDFQCTSLAENVALVTYHTVRQDLLTAVRTTTMRSSIWILEAERWRVRFHQGTRVP